MNQVELHTNHSTLLLLILIDIRKYKGIHIGAVAQSAGKKMCEWEKIEKGSVKITIDEMIWASLALEESPCTIIQIAEKIAPIFNRANWFFHSMELGPNEDGLTKLMNAYYAKSEHMIMPFIFCNILEVKNWNALNMYQSKHPTIVRYCCDPYFRQSYNNNPLSFMSPISPPNLTQE